MDPHLYYQSSLQWAYAVQADPTLGSSRPDVAALDRATALDPRYYLYALEQGRAGVFYRDPAAQVIAVHEEVLDLYETSPEANARLAREHAVAGDATLAEEYLGVVIVQSPLDAGTLDLAAEAFAYLGDEESAAQYRKAAEDARALAR
jgi:Tfp pilus assembly protein PilF